MAHAIVTQRLICDGYPGGRMKQAMEVVIMSRYALTLIAEFASYFVPASETMNDYDLIQRVRDGSIVVTSGTDRSRPGASTLIYG